MNQRDCTQERIRGAIDALRSADEREAPSFDRVITRTFRRPTMDQRRVAQLAAALVLLATALGLVTRLASRGSRIIVPREIRALSTWRPMTDVLLDTPNASILMGTPQFDESVLSTPIPILEDGQ